MAKALEFGNVPALSKEMQESVASAFDTLSRWRDDIDNVNERYLEKVLKQTSDVARSMGWPDEVIRAAHEYLTEISNTQRNMIDQTMESWKHQLTSTTAPMTMPRGFSRQWTGATSAFGEGMPQFNPLDPWSFWLQAAEMWQRTWTPASSQRDGRRH